MERHAVPQNIMEVEFKLFGSLTVKQFAYLAGGLMVGLSVYFLPFPIALRFVLIVISVVLGLFLSLVKINGQYSSIWLSNFIVAMFTSQERVWKKTGVVPDIFKEEVKRTKEEAVAKVTKSGRLKATVTPYSRFETKVESTKADREEELKLKQIESQIFSTDEQNHPEDGANMDLYVNRSDGISKPLSIKGYVEDKNSKPIPNALVSLNTESGEFIKEVLTDKEGFFDFIEEIPPGVYFASIVATNYNFDFYKITIKADQNILYKFVAK